ncbi:MAG: BirA family transcriptional regulator [Candidatus Poribacteria bacterium]|nr:BirA family transcriptional regulator [Candidatus Poribacteria bacterium]
MTSDEIKAGLNTKILGKEVVFYTETTSTNDIALVLAGKGADEGTLVIADSQTMGRGRGDHKWLAPAGTSILASLILRPLIELSQINKIVLITAISIVYAIHNVIHQPALIKWPNDVVINNKKIAGILAETKTEKNSVSFVVVGFGINVNVPKISFPEEIADIATSLSIESGCEISRIHLLQEILRQIESRYLKLDNDSFLDEWKNLSATIGRQVQIEYPDSIKTGFALDIDENGALTIKLNTGETQRIMNDDIVRVKTK